MEQEKTIWKILTLVVSIAAIGASIFCHFDAKNSTENKIVEALAERYESVDREMSYEQALQAVDREMEKLKMENSALQADNVSLQEKISTLNADKAALQEKVSILNADKAALQGEISSLKNENDRADKIALAESYASSGNYEVAIPILNSVSEKNEEVAALLKNYSARYEVSVIGEAETLAGNGDFDEALAVIDEALKIVPDDQLLLDKRNNIEPKYLVDTIECFKAENLWLLDSKEYVKMSGKSYRHAIYSRSSDIGVTMFNNAYSASAFYNLEGKYNQLSGIAGHIDFSGSGTIGESDSGHVYSAEITIWGDGKEIDTITLSADDTAKEFNKSIQGVEILEFRIKCSGNSSVGIAEIQIH